MDNKIDGFQAKVAKFLSFGEAIINMPEPNLSKGYLEGKNQMVSVLWSKIDSMNDEIQELATQEYEVDLVQVKKEYEQAFNMLDKVTIKIHTKLDKYNKPVVPQIQPLQLPENLVLNTHNKSNIKLKPIDIPTFSGDYKKWISFKNMFDSLVHIIEEFTKLQKIHYLKSCLSGEAERIISQFDITEKSYDLAYTAITERFHNVVVLVDTHIISILSQPDVTSESSHGLKELMDVTTENLRALNSFKIDTTTWEPILLLLLVQKLDPSTRRLWEQNLKPKTRPTIKEFLDFLGTRFHALGCQQSFKFSMESSSSNTTNQNNKKSFPMANQYNKPSQYKSQFTNSNFPPRIHQNFHTSTSLSQRPCPICPGECHSIFNCESFRKAIPRTRIEMAICANLCRRCLRGHKTVCTYPEGCRECGGNHHTFLHLHDQEDRNMLVQTSQQEGNSQTSAVINSHQVSLQRTTTAKRINSYHANIMTDGKSEGNNQIDGQVIRWDAPVLLATAVVLIRSVKDKSFYPFRCLLDQGGEASYISQSAVRFLGLREKSISATMVGLGGIATISSKSVVDFELGSKLNQEFSINVQALVVSKVTNPLPSTFIQRIDWKHIEGLRLADPEFDKAASIDVILGAPVYGYLLLPGLIKGTPDSPVAQNTELGWILSGATEPNSDPVKISSNHLEIKSIERKIQPKANN